MTSVWLIESGEYSAYEVWAVCVTEDEAAQVAAKMNQVHGSSYCEFTYSERSVVTEDDVLPVFAASVSYPWTKGGGYDFDAEPNSKAEAEEDSVIFRPEDPSEPVIWHERRDDEGRLVGAHLAKARASDPDVALKVARDALAKARAEELGL